MPETTTPVTARSWGMLFTEMVLIVASILLAFALDSWWQDRKDAQEEARLLQDLHEEFTRNRETLQYYRDFNTRGTEQLLVLSAAANAGRWETRAMGPDEAMSGLLIPPTSDLGTGVLSTLITSGSLDLLRDPGLRKKLAAWNGVYGELQDDELISRQYVFDTVVPFLVDEGLPLSGPFALAGLAPTSVRAIDSDPERFQQMLGDPSFAVLLDVRLAYRVHTDKEFQTVMDAVDGILADIELSRRGR